MEIPRPPLRRPGGGGGLPPIYIDDSSPPRPYGAASRSPYASSFSSALASIPMPIPNTSDEFHAPPPLPPPRVVPVPGPMSAAAEEYRRRELEPAEEIPNYKMRLDRDEGYYSMESRSRDSFPSAKMGLLQGPYQFRPSSDAYDNSLLSKLDIRGTFDNRSPPPRHGGGLSASAHDLRPGDRFAALQPLSLPTRMKQQHGQPLLDSPNRFTETPQSSAVSPRSNPFSHHGLGLSDYDRSPSVRTRRTDSGSLTDETASHDPMDDEAGFTMDDTSRLRDLRIDGTASAHQAARAHHASSSSSLSARDYHASTGQKRRASSPPGGDEPPPLPLYGVTSSEHLRRREGVSRGSPAPRLSAAAPHDTLSSSCAAGGRPGSYCSAQSPAAASATSARRSSHEGRSPVACMSPSETTTTGTSACTSPYMATVASIPLAMSPHSAGPRTPHHRAGCGDHPPRGAASPPPHRAADMGKSSGLLKRSDFFMCDCCPKKPKKFESEEQLRAHEMEKQYECHYCGNRFKNKNEAERHQNSLHVRRHSWSCAALSGYDRAFHESTFRPGEVDMCGYCGEEFARSGTSSGTGAGVDQGSPSPRRATDQDWDERIRHLQDVHKFRECNASKKFFRADHFRQHLKHSHAGTSGKWTNMLENACMIEEEPPLPMR